MGNEASNQGAGSVRMTPAEYGEWLLQYRKMCKREGRNWDDLLAIIGCDAETAERCMQEAKKDSKGKKGKGQPAKCKLPGPPYPVDPNRKRRLQVQADALIDLIQFSVEWVDADMLNRLAKAANTGLFSPTKVKPGDIVTESENGMTYVMPPPFKKDAAND